MQQLNQGYEILASSGSNDSEESVIVSFQFIQNEYIQNIKPDQDTAILIDTESTCSIIKNRKMVLNIRDSETILRAYTNGGHQDTHQRATMPGFFDVWFYPESM